MDKIELAFLLPCRGLEDLSLERSQDEAEQLLAAWTGLFHPALIARAQTAPKWLGAEDPPSQPAGLVVVPPCCEPTLPSDWLKDAEQAGAQLIRHCRRREEVTAAAAERLGVALDAVAPELAADFPALAYGYFLIEMLTRQLRYMSNLDEVSFQAAALAAANAAADGDAAGAQRELQHAFTLLHQAREYYYPVEAHLVDLTVVAPTTFGAPLRRELAGPRPCNLLISGATLAELARCEPDTLALLRAALDAGTAAVVGGEAAEPPLPLLPPDAISAELARGAALYQQHLGRRPAVFGRRRFGLTPTLPQALIAAGFSGALHSTLDDGRFPAGNQSRIQWEGLDGTTIEAIGRVPLDVARADVFLRLPERLGSSMDLDHVATIVFAHWPGQTSPWYDALQRIAAYTSTVGSFTTVDRYFSQTGTAGHRSALKADEYRSPYLRQAVEAGQRDPISRWTRYYSRRAAMEAAAGLHAIATACGMTEDRLGPPATGHAELFAEVDRRLEADSDRDEALDGRIETALGAAVQLAAGAVSAGGGSDKPGRLVLNPASGPRQSLVDLPGRNALPDVAGPVLAAAESDGGQQAIVETPAMGFAWVGPGEGLAPPPPQRKGWFFARKAPPAAAPLAEDHLLQNEFFQVVIDPVTGGIRAVLDPRSRGPRLAQQLALRWPEGDPHDPGHESHYSIMAADEVRTVAAGPLAGEIASRGRLMDRHGRRMAQFAQRVRVRKASRLIELEIELRPDEPPGENPWQCYYAARFAWSDETTTVYRGVNLACVRTELSQFESPHLVELRTDKLRTAIVCAGLPYHRKLGFRRLDTLLAVRGETQQRFRLGLGFDLPNPMAAALDFLAPPAVVPAACPPAAHGWLFHVEARGVVATHWSPLWQQGQCAGMRVRLRETEGRRVRFGLRAARTLSAAAKIQPGDQPPEPLTFADDRAEIEIAGYGAVEIELQFAA